MSIIKIPLRFEGSKDEAVIYTLFDSGATFSCISQENDIRLSDEFMVIPNISEDVILGVNTLQKWRIKLDFEHDTVIIDPKVAKAMLK